jgi:hypothetical protein
MRKIEAKQQVAYGPPLPTLRANGEGQARGQPRSTNLLFSETAYFLRRCIRRDGRHSGRVGEYGDPPGWLGFPVMGENHGD